jgi:hypothetical protein
MTQQNNRSRARRNSANKNSLFSKLRCTKVGSVEIENRIAKSDLRNVNRIFNQLSGFIRGMLIIMDRTQHKIILTKAESNIKSLYIL